MNWCGNPQWSVARSARVKSALALCHLLWCGRYVIAPPCKRLVFGRCECQRRCKFEGQKEGAWHLRPARSRRVVQATLGCGSTTPEFRFKLALSSEWKSGTTQKLYPFRPSPSRNIVFVGWYPLVTSGIPKRTGSGDGRRPSQSKVPSTQGRREATRLLGAALN